MVRMAEEMGCTVDALALGVILAQDFQPYVLSGAVTVRVHPLKTGLNLVDYCRTIFH